MDKTIVLKNRNGVKQTLSNACSFSIHFYFDEVPSNFLKMSIYTGLSFIEEKVICEIFCSSEINSLNILIDSTI